MKNQMIAGTLIEVSVYPSENQFFIRFQNRFSRYEIIGSPLK